MNFEDNESITKSSTATTGFATELITVYHGPDESVYAQVGSIGPNETVNILAKSMEWYHIEYTVGTTTQRKTGYVPMSSLSNITGDTVTEEDFYGGYCYATTELDVRTCDVFENTAPVGTLFAKEGCTMLFSYYVGNNNIAFIEYSTPNGTKRGYVYAQYLVFPCETIVGVANEYIQVYGGPDFENSAIFGTIYKNELISVLAKQGNIIYVEYNTIKGRKRGYIDWGKINPRDYNEGKSFNTFYTLKNNSNCYIMDEPSGVDVYAGPSTMYAKIGKVNCENVICFWTNDNNFSLSCIEYMVSSTGKRKRGYIEINKINIGNFPYENNVLEDLSVNFTHFNRFVYGKTQLNKDMVYYKTGNGPNHIFLTFALHGWEDGKKVDGTYYHGDGNMLTKIAKRFMNRFSELNDVSLSDIQNKWTIFVFPGINLDGIVEGYSVNSFGRCLASGLDPNRNWPGNFSVNLNNSRYKTGTKYLGNNEDHSDAIELMNLKNVIIQNVGTKNVLVDVHGWLNKTIGNKVIGDYYCNAFDIPKSEHIYSYGNGYLIAWANNTIHTLVSNKNLPGIKAGACLVELPATQDYSDNNMNLYGDKFFLGTLNLLNNLGDVEEDEEDLILYPDNPYEKLYHQLYLLYNYANEYKPEASIKEKNILVLHYLRQGEYSKSYFNFLYGSRDIEIIDFVNDKFIGDETYLKEENIKIPDPVITEGIPIGHLALALNGYLYNHPSFMDDIRETHSNNVGCWAGDLINIANAFEKRSINLSLEKAQQILGTLDVSILSEYGMTHIDDCGFSYYDWVHDIDAVNLKDLLEEDPIYDAFRYYYSNSNMYNYRYHTFISKAIPNAFINGIIQKNTIYSFVKQYLDRDNYPAYAVSAFLEYNGGNSAVLAEAFTNKIIDFCKSEIPNITYSAHCQNVGWQNEKSNWEYAGTTNQGLRMEAIIINADIDIKYRVHVEKMGWTPWVTNGQIAGSVGRGLRMEALEIETTSNLIQGQAHVENIGYQEVRTGSKILLGTEGKGLRLEGVKLKFLNLE